jgi:hypothetical protein
VSVAPDAVFLGGNVLALEAANRRVEALAALHGRIVALGTTKAIRALAGRATRRHDLGGATVVPGFNDAHCHVLSFELSLRRPRGVGRGEVARLGRTDREGRGVAVHRLALAVVGKVKVRREGKCVVVGLDVADGHASSLLLAARRGRESTYVGRCEWGVTAAASSRSSGAVRDG